MPTHNITTKPTHFERPQLSGFWKAKRDGLGTSSPRTQTRNPKRSSPECAPLAVQGAPQNLSTLLPRDLLAGQFAPTLHILRGYTPAWFQTWVFLQNAINFDDSHKRAQDVHVVQKCEHLFAWASKPRNCLQLSMLPKG